MPPAILAAGMVAAGTIGGAMIGSNAAGKAADAQAQAAANSLAFQQQVYGDTKANMAPFIGAGTNATNTLAQIYGWGTGGPTSPNALQAFFNTPDYNFSLTQGMRALDMSAAANHTLTSGGMVRAAQDYGQGLASTQYGNTIQRLISLMGIGTQAAGAMGGTAAQMGQSIGGTFQAQGQAQAGGIMGQANPFVSALNTGPGNALAAYSYFNNPLNGMTQAGQPQNINPSGYVVPPNYNPNQLSQLV